MLEHEQFALQKIRNVSLKIIALRLFQYPKDVRVPKTFVHGVRIVVGIEEAMMHTVIMGPRKHAPFQRRRAEEQEQRLYPRIKLVSEMRVLSVIRSDAEGGQRERDD